MTGCTAPWMLDDQLWTRMVAVGQYDAFHGLVDTARECPGPAVSFDIHRAHTSERWDSLSHKLAHRRCIQAGSFRGAVLASTQRETAVQARRPSP